jgi:hypothetical protein
MKSPGNPVRYPYLIKQRPKTCTAEYYENEVVGKLNINHEKILYDLTLNNSYQNIMPWQDMNKFMTFRAFFIGFKVSRLGPAHMSTLITTQFHRAEMRLRKNIDLLFHPCKSCANIVLPRSLYMHTLSQ